MFYEIPQCASCAALGSGRTVCKSRNRVPLQLASTWLLLQPAQLNVRRSYSSMIIANRPGQLAAYIALGITWGGLVGDRGHRKGQLRVLGRPSARHTKEPRTGGPPGGRGRTRFFFGESPFVHI
jgi:hypothetical protein